MASFSYLAFSGEVDAGLPQKMRQTQTLFASSSQNRPPLRDVH